MWKIDEVTRIIHMTDLQNYSRRIGNSEYRIQVYRQYANKHGLQLYVLNLTSSIQDFDVFKEAYESWKRSMTATKKSPFKGSWLGVIETTEKGFYHIHAIVLFTKKPSSNELREIEAFAAQKWRLACFRRNYNLNEMSCSIKKTKDSNGRCFGEYMSKLVDYRDPRNKFCPKPKISGKSFNVSHNLPKEVKELLNFKNLPSYHLSGERILNDLLQKQGVTQGAFRQAWRN